MPLAAILVALLTVQGSLAPKFPLTDALELNSLAKGTRRFVPRDEFDSPPSQVSLAGRRFVIELQPWTISKACFGYPHWSYDASAQTLHVDPGGSSLKLNTFSTRQGDITKKPVRDIWGEEIEYFASDCARANLPSYTASNAYGAKFQIDPTLQTIAAIADDLPAGSALNKSFEIHITGSEARKLVPNLRIRMSGLLADWKPGVSVACGRKRDGPTANSPYDRAFEYCFFNGTIERVDLLDVRTGEVVLTLTR